MATTQLEFQQVADELKIEFADFFKPANFTRKGAYDPLARTTTGDIDLTVDALREEYNAQQIDGQSIQVNDFKLLIVASEFTTIQPTADGLSCIYDGRTITVKRAMLDAANAMYTLQVRG